MPILRVPFTYSGWVDVEVTDLELASNDWTPIHEKAADELEHIELLGELDFDGFDMTSAEIQD